MRHLGKILALLAGAGALLALTAWLCGRRRHHRKSCYVTLYNYED